MIGIIITLIYPVAWLFTARKIYFAFRSDEFADNDDAMDNAMCGILSMLGALFWPLALPLVLVMVKPRATDKELEDALAERDRHIKDLERELGIR